MPTLNNAMAPGSGDLPLTDPRTVTNFPSASTVVGNVAKQTGDFWSSPEARNAVLSVFGALLNSPLTLSRTRNFVGKDYPRYISDQLKTGGAVQNPLTANAKSLKIAAPVMGELASLAGPMLGPVGAFGGGAAYGVTNPNSKNRLADAGKSGLAELVGYLLLTKLMGMGGSSPSQTSSPLGSEQNPIVRNFGPQIEQGVQATKQGMQLPPDFTPYDPRTYVNLPPINNIPSMAANAAKAAGQAVPQAVQQGVRGAVNAAGQHIPTIF